MAMIFPSDRAGINETKLLYALLVLTRTHGWQHHGTDENGTMRLSGDGSQSTLRVSLHARLKWEASADSPV